MFKFIKTVTDIYKDFDSLLKSCPTGGIVLSTNDNNIYVKTEDTFVKYNTFPSNYSTFSEPTLKKEMKVYKCPNCANSIHYLQTECEFCSTKISWV